MDILQIDDGFWLVASMSARRKAHFSCGNETDLSASSRRYVSRCRESYRRHFDRAAEGVLYPRACLSGRRVYLWHLVKCLSCRTLFGHRFSGGRRAAGVVQRRNFASRKKSERVNLASEVSPFLSLCERRFFFSFLLAEGEINVLDGAKCRCFLLS